VRNSVTDQFFAIQKDKPREESSMDNLHNAVRHLKYLRQSLSQDNESIGFFLSAGCPLSVDMADGQEPLIPDVAGLSKYVNVQLSDNPNFVILLNELTKAGKNKENIEDTLSFVRSLYLVSEGGDVRGLSQSILADLEKSICSEIVSRLNVQLPNTESPYHRLGKWIKSIDRKVAVEVFTTNYDLLAEQSLEDLGVPYFDGFVGSRKSFFDLRAVEDGQIPLHWSRLWKIHGSINWVQEKAGNRTQVHRSSEVKKDASHLIFPSHLKYEQSRKMPYLALMDQLSRFIRKKSAFLVLSGYSFNDEHVNDTLVNALIANPTAMVLGLMFGNYEIESASEPNSERYPNAYRLAKNQHNLNIWTFDKAIIGTNLGCWARSTKEEEADPELLRFVDSEQLVGEENAHRTLVKLGNFSIFTNFLQRIIGATRESKNG
jgi:SIR2-like domain